MPQHKVPRVLYEQLKHFALSRPIPEMKSRGRKADSTKDIDRSASINLMAISLAIISEPRCAFVSRTRYTHKVENCKMIPVDDSYEKSPCILNITLTTSQLTSKGLYHKH